MIQYTCNRSKMQSIVTCFTCKFFNCKNDYTFFLFPIEWIFSMGFSCKSENTAQHMS